MRTSQNTGLGVGFFGFIFWLFFVLPILLVVWTAVGIVRFVAWALSD